MQFFHFFPLLSLAIGLPIAFGILVLLSSAYFKPACVRWLALLGAGLSFAVTLPLATYFNAQTAALQFVERIQWIERFNASYYLGVDGI